LRELPSGTVTFLFTDVEGSTALLHELGAEAYAGALAEHRRALREAFGTNGGVEVDTQGDAFFYAFADAGAAVAAAAAANEALAGGPIRIRMGLHTGEPHLTEEGYVGEVVHLGARIAAAGHGGQVLLSAATSALVDEDATELGEHRLKDFAEPVALFQLGSGRFPPLKTISSTNLPRPASSFVGRERETADVVALLQDGARLVTLSGPGGSGKTRLALEAAAELVGAFKAGVFWVGLAALRDPSLVLETAAQTLGAKDGLAEHVGERELLLVLDNLEQVVDAAPGLATLVESCRNLHLLVTSRELLRVRGEVEYPVPPLTEPEAVNLFCERARLEPDDTIAELCRRLDDLPLAVELAAARTGVLSPAQIVDRLSQRLDLLKGGRDADVRQQTLRATIEWSHDLLSPAEQQLFARLAVFAGGCALDAAEGVAGADLDVLQSLVDKSLVRRHTDERFWMLETVREYALERLGSSGEGDELRRRHAEHFLALAEEALPHLLSADAHEWPDRLEEEHDNLRAALDTFEAIGDGETLLELAGALAEFWGMRGHNAEGWRRLDRSLQLDERPTAVRARALCGAADLAVGAGEPRAARPLAEAGVAVYRRLGDERGIPLALFSLGNAAVNEADVAANEGLEEDRVRLHREGQELLARAAELFERLGDEHLALLALYQLSYAQIELGETERGKELREEILRRARALGDTQAESDAVGGLVRFAFGEDRFEDALSLLGAAIRIELRVGNLRRIAMLLGRCGYALARLGRESEATQVLSRSQAIYDETGISIVPWTVREIEHTIDLIRTKLDDTAYDEAWEQGSRLTVDEAVALALGEAPAGA
jgi:predicted ATPase